MSVSLQLPDFLRRIAGLEGRVGILERRITSSGESVDRSHSILFSLAGGLSVSTSPPVRVWRGGNLTVIAVTLGTAGTTDTVIDVFRNGTVVATITVPDGATAHNGSVFVRFAAEDSLALEITTAGTGAADMTAEARVT